ncbi:ShlB/FhaC/HecB family hemolysin secretion/activation protein [Pseudomonas kairouanensis]|uniref:ShlB/FhaC/HecB family hemolysin secretion/activation protein n=1 Tax=Pseudomonas kairouanensis TaxID=2293832 RepID=A0A4Z0AGS5_9PSED|nr:ShlB/FhaC/HecB family hemolysin secretion/activation protein [Pseudomonas kairouanensis]TFY85620.1 ShlB/FhaC/HecB family hemolysin secretion/activation protein [Pseudomonas kairouanensis]
MSAVFRPVLLGFALLSGPLLAAPQPSPGDRELARERQQQLLDEQRRRLDELKNLPGEAVQQATPALADDGQCITFIRINIEGTTVLSDTQRQALLQPWHGRCLGVPQLNEMLKGITDHYLHRGYITTRAYLPQQDLRAGELKIIVVEGRLEGFDNSSLASPLESAMTFPGSEGEVLDLRELEQWVDQLARLPSRQPQLELVPGQSVGGSRVSLKGARLKPWRVAANRNNHGDASTGRQQAGIGLEWDSPLGLADQLSLRANRDMVSDHWRHSHSQSLFYSVPYGWWTFDFSHSQSAYRTRNTASGFEFALSGDTSSQHLRAERLLHRDNLGKTALNIGLSHLRTRNYLEDALLRTSSHRITESQVGLNHGRRIGNAFVNLDAGWQQGIGALDAQRDLSTRRGAPTSRYQKYTLTLSYLQSFGWLGQHWTFDSLATGQHAEDELYGPQRLSVGGLGAVRGFQEQNLSGNTGGYWRSQLRWRHPVVWEAVRPWVHEVGVGFGYDVGVISRGPHNPHVAGRLSGNAWELSARGTHLAASLVFARSLESPAVVEHREHPLYARIDLFF